MESTRSSRIGVILASLLLVTVLAGGWTVVSIDLAAKNQTSELAEQTAPASLLLLNLDRDAYQAQLFLERVVEIEAKGADASAEREFQTENVAQLLGPRWTEFRAIGKALSDRLPGEAERVAMYEADRDIWMATVAETMEAAPGAERGLLVDRSKSEFELMRHHLDVLEEEFYEPRIESLGRETLHSIDRATIVVAIALTVTALIGAALTAVSVITVRSQDRSYRAREEALLATSRRQRFETQLRRALEMTRDEDRAIEIIARATRQGVPDHDHNCLLVTDSSRSHLRGAFSDGAGPGCAVEFPEDCRALTTGTLQVFGDSTELDACPFLADRDDATRTAMCAPLSIGGRSTAVIHVTRRFPDGFTELDASALSTIADHGGIRLSVIRNDAVVSAQATTDPLTGLENRRSFENRATAMLADEPSSAVLMIDLDNFKSLNDTHGHDTGDRALRLFSDALRDVTLDDTALASRWGGEEFVVLLSGADLDNGRTLAEQLRDAVAVRLIEGSVPRFTVSIGVASDCGEALSLADLVSHADRALYEAKKAGRDCVITSTQ